MARKMLHRIIGCSVITVALDDANLHSEQRTTSCISLNSNPKVSFFCLFHPIEIFPQARHFRICTSQFGITSISSYSCLLRECTPSGRKSHQASLSQSGITSLSLLHTVRKLVRSSLSLLSVLATSVLLPLHCVCSSFHGFGTDTCSPSSSASARCSPYDYTLPNRNKKRMGVLRKRSCHSNCIGIRTSSLVQPSSIPHFSLKRFTW